MKRRITKSSALALVGAGLLCLGLTSSSQAQTTCIKKGKNFCRSTTTLSQYTGTPTIPCIAGDIVVKIDSKADCFGGGAGPVTVFRCGKFSNGFSYSGNGLTHSFELVKGATWKKILLGACEGLKYKVSN